MRRAANFGFRILTATSSWSRTRKAVRCRPKRLGKLHMPFKSKAQRRKFAELLVKGKISNETFEEWNRETGSAKLPERVKPKANKKSTAKSSAKRTAKAK